MSHPCRPPSSTSLMCRSRCPCSSPASAACPATAPCSTSAGALRDTGRRHPADARRSASPGRASLPSTPRKKLASQRLFRRVHCFRAVLDTTGNCALKVVRTRPRPRPPGQRPRARSASLGSPAGYGARLVHLSSDLVFSGCGEGGYVETDPTDPVTVYGKCMAEAEAAVAAHRPGGGRSCASPCRWGRASTATPGPSIGSPRASATAGPQRSTSTRCVRRPTATT